MFLWITSLVIADFSKWPEGMGHGARGDDENTTIYFFQCRLHGPSRSKEILRVPGLADTDGNPALIGESATQKVPKVGGRVENREVGVINWSHPGPHPRSLCADGMGKFRITEKVKRDSGHATGKFLRCEESGSAVLGRDHELNCGCPMRVHDDHCVVIKFLEFVFAQFAQPGN